MRISVVGTARRRVVPPHQVLWSEACLIAVVLDGAAEVDGVLEGDLEAAATCRWGDKLWLAERGCVDDDDEEDNVDNDNDNDTDNNMMMVMSVYACGRVALGPHVLCFDT